MAHSNVYVVTQDKRLVVIDTGTPGNAKKILAFIQEIGYKPQDVTSIILTHSHLDHIGSLKELKDLTGAKVASSEEEADVISGKKTIKPKKFLMRLAPLLIKAQAVDVDIALKNGDKIENFTVVSTPGHTPGSIMLYDMERKALFSGDSLRLENGKISTGPKQYSWDQEKEKDSIRKVSELDFDVLLPGHGDCLKDKASTAVREYAQNN